MDDFLFREGRLGGVLGLFFGFLEVVLDLILKLFREQSAQQTEHAKSTFYLHSEHFGPNFLDFRTLENTLFYITFGF